MSLKKITLFFAALSLLAACGKKVDEQSQVAPEETTLVVTRVDLKDKTGNSTEIAFIDGSLVQSEADLKEIVASGELNWFKPNQVGHDKNFGFQAVETEAEESSVTGFIEALSSAQPGRPGSARHNQGQPQQYGHNPRMGHPQNNAYRGGRHANNRARHGNPNRAYRRGLRHGARIGVNAGADAGYRAGYRHGSWSPYRPWGGVAWGGVAVGGVVTYGGCGYGIPVAGVCGVPYYPVTGYACAPAYGFSYASHTTSFGVTAWW